MSARRPAHALDAVAQKWCALAERRRAHFLELYDSGRWKHYYYSEEQFLYRMREAIRLAQRWAEIAPPMDEVAPGQDQSVAKGPHRTAA
jgi:uncharacterized repeat protein (TIGR03809 family)